VKPLHEAVDEAVVLKVRGVALARVARVVQRPDLKIYMFLIDLAIEHQFVA
jgi:hypothetical protein